MNKSNQKIALIITLFISVISLMTVFDTLSRFSFIFKDITSNIFSTPVIHTIYILLILILSFPALRFNFMTIKKRSYMTNEKMNNELLDSSTSDIEEKRKFINAWKWYYLFSIIFLCQPGMFIFIVLDKNTSINNPIVIITITLINILLGLFLIINARKTKDIKWL
jgi:hypothetical protein